MSTEPWTALTVVDGISTEVTARRRHYKERVKHARIYVGFDEYEARHRVHPNPTPEMFPHLDLPVTGNGKPTVYTTRKDFPEVDKAWDAANRDYARMAREVTAQALVGVGLHVPKMRYSRHAGCTCPCSPGIITDGMFVPGLGDQIDLWVTVSDEWAAQQRERTRKRLLDEEIAELGRRIAREGVRV